MTVAKTWNCWKRVAFRFAFAYLLLYNLPFPLNHVWQLAHLPEPVATVAGWGARTSEWYTAVWHGPVTWAGERVFGLTVAVRTNCDDSAYHYVKAFCFLVLAAVAAAVWTLLARSRSGHPRLHCGLRVYVRFALPSWLIGYAAFKVFKEQFPDPGLARLQQPVGEMSPMGLLWTFMGASEGYTAFTGTTELLAGLLLTARRTTLLGALLTAAVMANVLALNLCYDVCVKLFSFHLLFQAAFLNTPDGPRLLNLLVLGRPAAAVEVPRLFRRPWLDRGVVAVRTSAVLGFAGLLLVGASETRRTTGDLRPKPPLYGIWVVEEFTAGGHAVPPLATDPARWGQLVVDRSGSAPVQFMNQSRVACGLALDADARALALTKPDDPNWTAEFRCAQPEADVLTLDGTLAGTAVRVRCRRLDESGFLLVRRGFQLVNERPFIR